MVGTFRIDWGDSTNYRACCIPLLVVFEFGRARPWYRMGQVSRPGGLLSLKSFSERVDLTRSASPFEIPVS